MNKPKVFLTGGDNLGWALDDDLTQTRKSLDGIVEFCDLGECEVVHSMWWDTLLQIPASQLLGKRIICHLSGEPFRYLSLPRFSSVMPRVGKWVTQSAQAWQQLSSLHIESQLIPYTVDPEIFTPLSNQHEGVRNLKRQWNIPGDRYLIGNFHRDTEGKDLSSPKLVKGPDLFAEIMAGLNQRGLPIHVVLAGPRRFWLKERLDEYSVPYTFVGETVAGDDISVNRQSRTALNLLYNLLDIYLITSRSEGGPRAILEAAAAKCKILSTRVGLALDVLEPQCLFSDVAEAIHKIQQDIAEARLSWTVQHHREKVLARHLPERNKALFSELYGDISSVPALDNSSLPQTFAPKAKSQKFWQVIRSWRKHHHSKELTVSLWHKFTKPPFGGGNQFMLALREGLSNLGVDVRENTLGRNVDAHVINAIWFDVEKFRLHRQQSDIRILHRIDGPISLIRGKDRHLDDQCFALNRELASATVMQSAWTYLRTVELGYSPVNPTIISNGINPEIFHSQGRVCFDSRRKARLISSSWSDNPRKGGPIYKWLDEHLDWNRFEYTFVGRVSESFQNICHIDPVPSEKLAELLRQHDIYITASQNDPCSNAVIEALACGLPVLYYNDGGHPELVGFGGLPFNDSSEILPQLDKLVENYEAFQRLIVVPSLDEVAGKYLELLQEIAHAG